MNPALAIGLEAPDQPDVVALIDALDAYQAPLYPPESNHLLDIGALKRPEVAFLVARDAQGQAVGCAALVVQPEHGEIKRMFVQPALRGRGVAKALYARLEAEALRRGCTRLRLETGIRQPEALAFYERLGFQRRAPFGDYREDPLSVFMERPLDHVSIGRCVPDEHDLQALAEVLHACVQGGASVGFVLPFEPEQALAFWHKLLPGMQSGARCLLVARSGGRIVGTVQLVLDMPPNGAHRADLVKLLVHPAHRRHGIARRLMEAAHAQARAAGRTLLVLDTVSGSPAEGLYRSLGYQRCGQIPGYARSTRGTMEPTTVMYKPLE